MKITKYFTRCYERVGQMERDQETLVHKIWDPNARVSDNLICNSKRNASGLREPLGIPGKDGGTFYKRLKYWPAVNNCKALIPVPITIFALM